VKYRLLAIGKPKLDYAAVGIQDYANRLKHYAQLEIDYLKDRNESEALLARSKGSYRIALDERGTQHSTASLTKQITQLENRGDLKAVSFLVGGADGHSAAFRDQCDQIWSLSSMTMQHELALVVLLEQIYRVFTIKRGEPYHRE
jgi:23S rRNA (pseudouridine1915-N3)-methyltransferase